MPAGERSVPPDQEGVAFGGLIRPDFKPAALAQCTAVGVRSNPCALISRRGLRMSLVRVGPATCRCRAGLHDRSVSDPGISARALGADCALLIMARPRRRDRRRDDRRRAPVRHGRGGRGARRGRGLAGALKLDAPLMGMHNCNLKTLVTDATCRLAPRVPKTKTVVCGKRGFARPNISRP